MSTSAHQLSLSFACLDFPGRASVTVTEIADKLSITPQHVLDHIDAGRLAAMDSALVKSRRNIRVAVGEYRRWVLSLLTVDKRRSFLAELPAPTLRELQREIQTLLSA